MQSQYTFDHFPVCTEIWWESLSLSHWNHIFPCYIRFLNHSRVFKVEACPHCWHSQPTWVYFEDKFSCSPDFPVSDDSGVGADGSTHWIYPYQVLFVCICASWSPTRHGNDMQGPPEGVQFTGPVNPVMYNSDPSSYNLSLSPCTISLPKATQFHPLSCFKKSQKSTIFLFLIVFASSNLLARAPSYKFFWIFYLYYHAQPHMQNFYLITSK